ncbi:uncharacterized protein PAC_09553 [Phialocephala subalpina]|uniref:Uncharacterized protein n=1 Tax=Phialocephala subalpina TaxID=576137 RepID=A0A1L7X3Q7_9HELO|nr:uncharacterized protein PAC_09553 [Phialocephala subalpina]
MAALEHPSRKRAIDFTEDEIAEPARKRQEMEPPPKPPPKPRKPIQTTLREASELYQKSIRNTKELSKGRPTPAAKLFKARPIWFENRTPDASPYQHVHLVMQRASIDGHVAWERALDVYASLKDANRRVRNECFALAPRDNPDACFKEEVESHGGIEWGFTDLEGFGLECFVQKMNIIPPDREPTKDWGRDIGLKRVFHLRIFSDSSPQHPFSPRNRINAAMDPISRKRAIDLTEDGLERSSNKRQNKQKQPLVKLVAMPDALIAETGKAEERLSLLRHQASAIMEAVDKQKAQHEEESGQPQYIFVVKET